MQPDSVRHIGKIVQVNRWSSYAPNRVASLLKRSEGGDVTDLDASQRLLALRLGLGDLEAVPGCGGYQHGCCCSACRQREKTVTTKFRKWLESEVEAMPRYRFAAAKPAQPWQQRVA